MPSLFATWCQTKKIRIGQTHCLHRLDEAAGKRDQVAPQLDAVVASHYEDPQWFLERMRRLGYVKATEALAIKLPKTKKMRSGHLAEILASEAVNELLSPFEVVIKRLRWLDGNNVAMRGEDVIGINRTPALPRFLKGESKSRKSMTTTVLKEARKALEANQGRPSQHALSFLMERLREEGRDDLALLIEEFMLIKRIDQKQIVQMLFTLSENDAASLIEAELKGYGGPVEQVAIAMKVDGHQGFIAAVYDRIGTYGPNR